MRYTQSFVYLLEASLVIPLLSEFLEHALGDTEAQKQEGERRAFTEPLHSCRSAEQPAHRDHIPSRSYPDSPGQCSAGKATD